MTDLTTQREPELHIRYEGNSYDVRCSELDTGILGSDAEIRSAVANHLNVPISKLSNFSIDRNQETGDITLRPQAVFG